MKQFRTIAHIRLPNFLSSVEEALRPELRNLPFAVCGTSRNELVVACANEHARVAGIENGMTAAAARQLVPEAVFIDGTMHSYTSFSRELFSILGRFSPRIEPTSISSAWIELEGYEREWISAEQACYHLARGIMRELEIRSAIGVGSNKITAEVASKITTPGSVTSIARGSERAFLAPLPLRVLPGIGEHTAAALKACGLRTIGDIARTPREDLWHSLGQYGITIWQLANAFDGRPIATYSPAQSVSSTRTLRIPSTDCASTANTVRDQLRDVVRKMKTRGITGKTAFLRIQRTDGSFITKQKTFTRHTNDPLTLSECILQAYESLVQFSLPATSVCVGVKNIEHTFRASGWYEQLCGSSAAIQRSLKYMKYTLGISKKSRRRTCVHPEPQKWFVRGITERYTQTLPHSSLVPI